MKLRLLDAAEAEAVVAVLHAAFAAQSVPTEPPSAALQETAGTIRTALLAGGGAGVEAEGALVGAVLWVEREGGLYFGRLSVLPGWRGKGVARRLVEAVEDEARRLGLARVHLGTRLVLLDNRRLFASCGYREGAQSAHPGFDAPTSVVMEKFLDEVPVRATAEAGAAVPHAAPSRSR